PRHGRSGPAAVSTWSPIAACPTSPSSRPTSPRSRPWPITTSSGSRALSAERAGDEEFLVALGALDRAVGDSQHVPARLPGQPVGNRRADLGMQRGLAHDAAL